jgi:hypothetical protein
MGVMLALDRPGAARGRRQGQHARSDDQARADAFAALLSYDPACAGRYLSRLARPALAGRLRLAVGAHRQVARVGSLLGIEVRHRGPA